MITAVSGVLLILVGYLVATHEMTRLASELSGWVDDLGLRGIVRLFER